MTTPEIARQIIQAIDASQFKSDENRILWEIGGEEKEIQTPEMFFGLLNQLRSGIEQPELLQQFDQAAAKTVQQFCSIPAINAAIQRAILDPSTPAPMQQLFPGARVLDITPKVSVSLGSVVRKIVGTVVAPALLNLSKYCLSHIVGGAFNRTSHAVQYVTNGVGIPTSLGSFPENWWTPFDPLGAVQESFQSWLTWGFAALNIVPSLYQWWQGPQNDPTLTSGTLEKLSAETEDPQAEYWKKPLNLARKFSLRAAEITLQQAVAGLVQKIDEIPKEILGNLIAELRGEIDRIPLETDKEVLRNLISAAEQHAVQKYKCPILATDKMKQRFIKYPKLGVHVTFTQDDKFVKTAFTIRPAQDGNYEYEMEADGERIYDQLEYMVQNLDRERPIAFELGFYVPGTPVS